MAVARSHSIGAALLAVMDSDDRIPLLAGTGAFALDRCAGAAAHRAVFDGALFAVMVDFFGLTIRSNEDGRRR